MTHSTDPISTRLSAEGINAELVRHVARLEQIAHAKTVSVVTGGGFPHWSVERWLSVLTFVGVLVSGIWFASTQWNSVKRDVAELQQTVDALVVSIEKDRALMNIKMETLSQDVKKRNR